MLNAVKSLANSPSLAFFYKEFSNHFNTITAENESRALKFFLWQEGPPSEI